MNIKAKIISSFATFILGSNIFERVKAIVLRQEDKDIPGEAKRLSAAEEIKMIGLDIAGFLVNFAIEICVTYFKTLEQKK